jgi:hypothetical protein
MANNPPEYWVIQLDLGDHKVYLRKGYWTFYMKDIQFAQLFVGKDGKKKAEDMIEHIVKIITGPVGYTIVCESNWPSSPQIQVLDPKQLSAKQIKFTVV